MDATDTDIAPMIHQLSEVEQANHEPAPRSNCPSCAEAVDPLTVGAGMDRSNIDPPHIAYEAYMRSTDWRHCPARLEELALSGFRCRLCNEGPDDGVTLEVHHRTYAHLGREKTEDLTTLCSACHYMTTTELRRRRYAQREPPEPQDVRRLPLARTLVDPTRSPQ
jgi:5-methylcytosine-specific restriction endonuclease McrA